MSWVRIPGEKGAFFVQEYEIRAILPRENGGSRVFCVHQICDKTYERYYKSTYSPDALRGYLEQQKYITKNGRITYQYDF
jgi:hypothetical protein